MQIILDLNLIYVFMYLQARNNVISLSNNFCITSSPRREQVVQFHQQLSLFGKSLFFYVPVDFTPHPVVLPLLLYNAVTLV